MACAISILATPGGGTPREWIVNKTRGGALDLAAAAGAQGIAAGLKRATGRPRPDGSDERSFPSGHATRSALFATLAGRNARAALGEGRAADAAAWSTFALASACAWSRVEAGRHYDSDVLVGMALGHAVGALINDAFITPATPVSVRVSMTPGRAGSIVVSWRP